MVDIYKRHTPEGFQDILFPEYFTKKLIEEKIGSRFQDFGYFGTQTPILEYYDVFDNDIIRTEAMYKIFNHDGRILVLRPDMTIPIARIVASKLNNIGFPLRLSYIDNIFRFDESKPERKEISQAGIELIGVTNIKADAEVIIVIIEGLLSVGLKDFQIDIGQVDFFKGIVDGIEFNKLELETLREYVEKKNIFGISEILECKNIPENVRNILLKLPSFYGDVEIVEEVKQMNPTKRSMRALMDIQQIVKIISDRGYDKYVSIDLGMVNRLNYYTGMIFKGFTYGTGCPILNGGRYDSLIKNYGVDIPAVGGSININELMSVLNREMTGYNIPSVTAVFAANESERNHLFTIAQTLRGKGFIIEEDFNNDFSKTIEFAHKRCVRYAVYCKQQGKSIVYDTLLKIKQEYDTEELIKKMEEMKWNT